MTAAPPKEKAPARACNTEPGKSQDRTKSATKAEIFQPDILDGLRERLTDYLSACGLEFRRQGSRLVSRCPVHEDRHPSFAIFGNRLESCGCHPCGFSGDVFNVSQWMGRSASFPDAVREVAGVLGVYLPEGPAQAVRKPVERQQRPAKPAAPSFALKPEERRRIDAAGLAFTDAFWAEELIVDHIVESLGLDRETLRLASWGSSGLGLASPFPGWPLWLCYRYPQGLKWRNPDPVANGKPRFMWPVGKALAPWRWEWVNTATRTVYLTEGESDAMALIQAGAEVDGKSVCVAIPGKELPEEWGPLFVGKDVVLCFDGDGKSDEARDKAVRIIKPHVASVKVIQQWKGENQQ